MDILKGEIGWDITVENFRNKTEIVLNSQGGSLVEGLTIHDFIKNSDIEIGIIGVCMSAATLILLGTEKRWGTPNSLYLIHNPFAMTAGDSKSVQKTALELKKMQDIAVQIYENNLSIDKTEIQSLMDSEQILSSSDALRIGLIKEIRNFNETIDPEIQNNIENFTNKYKMQINMNTEIEKKISLIDKFFAKINKFLGVKMVVIQDVNGTEIEITEAENESEIKEGMAINAAGVPASGEFVFNSGLKITAESGKITAVEMPTEAENESETDALKAENENLKAENEKLKSEAQMRATENENFKLEFAAAKLELERSILEVKNLISTENAEDAKPEPTKQTGYVRR